MGARVAARLSMAFSALAAALLRPFEKKGLVTLTFAAASVFRL